ncbi:MAG TPA: aspartate carbamoyltransferase catalytic subunit [Bacteriovoracaceae bacterium]|nr:aspartate carbamoyltransferase catalytic subunit [Bacteriovoracaceae bacterium]
MIKHFLALANFSSTEIGEFVDRAYSFSLLKNSPDKINHLLKNKIFSNAFFEASTRTRSSFEIAAKRLGGDIVNFWPESSSTKKGETVHDTLKCLENLGVDGIILRHSDDSLIEQLAHKLNTPLINAGAGKFEHPSQGLLDLLTLKKEFGELKGLRVGICGDILHSRVAGSMMVAAKKLGFEVVLMGPENLIPKNNFKHADFDKTLPHLDAIMMLRIQHERHEGIFLNQTDYREAFGMTAKRASKLASHTIIMHPGPFNRGVEIDDEAIEHPNSRIWAQMENGVYARMSILEWAAGV